MVTQEKLKSLFEYDALNGQLIWRMRPDGNASWNARYAGAVAGCVKEQKGWRFRQIVLDGKSYLAHRLVWLWVNGWLPECLDHINRDSTDNRIENLRVADKAENGANSAKAKGRTSKFKGVFMRRRDGKYHAAIHPHGRSISLGSFESATEAAAAYNAAATAQYGQFACINPI